MGGIVKSLRHQEFLGLDSDTVHADLIPSFSEEVSFQALSEGQGDMTASVMHEDFPTDKLLAFQERPVAPKQFLRPKTVPVAPVPPRVFVPAAAPSLTPVAVPAARPQTPVIRAAPVGTAPLVNTAMQTWNKIVPLIRDTTITQIECTGENKPLLITRFGTRQPTRVLFTKEDTNNFLKIVSEKSHIPLLEGVFSAFVDDISVYAVVSQLIGSKFILRKTIAPRLA